MTSVDLIFVSQRYILKRKYLSSIFMHLGKCTHLYYRLLNISKFNTSIISLSPMAPTLTLYFKRLPFSVFDSTFSDGEIYVSLKQILINISVISFSLSLSASLSLSLSLFPLVSLSLYPYLFSPKV